mmetsp:Transcript_80126/g.223089  ORF Transcript_80126/g.223089 Transcript_80126/m.223089 type:complete len:233 (-) Transcript_80126:86-784(-)
MGAGDFLLEPVVSHGPIVDLLLFVFLVVSRLCLRINDELRDLLAPELLEFVLRVLFCMAQLRLLEKHQIPEIVYRVLLSVALLRLLPEPKLLEFVDLALRFVALAHPLLPNVLDPAIDAPLQDMPKRLSRHAVRHLLPKVGSRWQVWWVKVNLRAIELLCGFRAELTRHRAGQELHIALHLLTLLEPLQGGEPHRVSQRLRLRDLGLWDVGQRRTHTTRAGPLFLELVGGLS